MDLAPTILAASGTPSSVRHSGRVLTEAVGEVAAAAAGDPERPEAPSTTAEGLDEAEAEEVEEHLRGLGYLE